MDDDEKTQPVDKGWHPVSATSIINHDRISWGKRHEFNGIFLVFEYVPNGTLRSFVSDGQSGHKFTWAQRIAVAIGEARGIQFLQTRIVPGVYSNRLKITDILLDNDLHVKIKKYNLPLLTENRRSSGGMEILPAQSKGKFGSILNCEEKHDIYNFGVMLLEMIVGRTIISPDDVNISKDIVSR
ncbi:hypothetical protein ACS0TY_026656 [Phlomoides rotata]